MSFFEATSEGISSGEPGAVVYSVAKWRRRRQWALMADHRQWVQAVAYFRSEGHAREFAATFGLTITEHGRV